MKKEYLLYIFIFVVMFILFFVFQTKNKHKNFIELNWNLGDELTYEYKLESQTYISGKLIAKNTPDKTEKLINSGKLLFKIIDLNKNEVILNAMVIDYISKNNDALIKNNFSNLPVLITLYKTGEIKKIVFSKLLSKSEQVELKSIIYACQFTFYNNRRTWAAIETNPFGKYSSDYVIKNKIINRNILKYNSIADNFMFKKSHILVKKNLTKIELSKNKSWFKKINTKFDMDIYKNKQKVFNTTGSITINLVNNDNSKKFWSLTANKNKLLNSLQHPFKNKVISTIEKKAEMILDEQKHKVNKNVENTLDQLEKEGVKIENVMNMYITKMYDPNIKPQTLKQISDIIVAYLKKHPSETYKIVDIIRNKQVPEKGSGRLFSILEQVGHQEAQNALLSMLEDITSFSRLTHIRAAAALMGIKNISEQSFDKLIDIEASNLIPDKNARGSVLLAIGSLGSVALNPDIKEKAKNYLRTKIESIKNKNDLTQATILDAIGNMADPTFIDDLKPFIFESKNEIIKDRAINALTHMPEKDADPLIIDILKKDDIYNIKSAVDVLNTRENFNNTNKINPEINEVLLNKMPTTKGSLNVRIGIAKYLSIEKANHSILKKIADDRKEDYRVRKAIYERLPFGGKRTQTRGPGKRHRHR